VGVLNIQKIVLLGDMTCFGEKWLNAIHDSAQKYSLQKPMLNTKIEIGQLGENSIILGATAILATDYPCCSPIIVILKYNGRRTISPAVSRGKTRLHVINSLSKIFYTFHPAFYGRSGYHCSDHQSFYSNFNQI
jgi:hypothetical protein